MPTLGKIALLGADDPLAGEVLRVLDERDVAIAELFPLTQGESDVYVSFQGGDVPALPVTGFDWSRVELVLAVSRAAWVRPHIDAALAAGCRVLGVLNGEEPASERWSRIPCAFALAMQRVLLPIQRLAPLRQVHAVAHLPVSLAGQAGVDELSGQTRALFAMESVEAEVFPLQIAFNLQPYVRGRDPRGLADVERQIADDLRQGLGCPDMPAMVSALWAPLFFGGGVNLHGEIEGGLDLAGLVAALDQAEGLTVMDEGMPGGTPTPATDALESEDVFVGCLGCEKKGDGDSSHFKVWLVFDVTRLEAARMAGAVEKMIEIKAISVLT